MNVFSCYRFDINLILYFHLRLRVLSCLFPPGYANKTPTHATCLAHLILLLFIHLMYIWRAASSIQFPNIQFTPLAFHRVRARPRPAVSLSTPFSDTLSQCSSLTVTVQLSHPPTATGTTVCLHVGIFICIKTTTGGT